MRTTENAEARIQDESNPSSASAPSSAGSKPKANTQLRSHIENVENHLNLLLDDLSQLVTRNFLPLEETSGVSWERELDGFRVKASTIRRILDRFHNADLPTRRYLRQHLDEEWSQLKLAYDSLREQFTSMETPSKSKTE